VTTAVSESVIQTDSCVTETDREGLLHTRTTAPLVACQRQCHVMMPTLMSLARQPAPVLTSADYRSINHTFNTTRSV